MMFNTQATMTDLNSFPTEAALLNIIDQQYDSLEGGLVYGKAGLALYYAKLSNEDTAYKKIYNRLVDDVLTKVSDKTPVEFSRGLLGIAFALDIIMHYFKPGNPDYVLDDMDALIYKSLDKGRDRKPLDENLAVEGLFYLSMHLKYGIRNTTKHRIYADKAMQLLNDLCITLPVNFFQEPIPCNVFNRSFFLLYAIGNLYEQNIGRQRIEHICDDLIYELGANVPIFHFNRLERCFLVIRLISLGCAKHPNWKEYQKLLLDSLSLKRLFNEECANNQLALSDGLTGAMLLILGANKYSPVPLFDVPWEFYKDRLNQCDTLTLLNGKETPLYKYGINWLWGMKGLLNIEHSM